MKFIGDLHIHSHYSIATSKQLVPEYLDLWGRIKGIKVIGTGDFTHPGWIGELKKKLEPSEPGLFRLKDKYRLETDRRYSPETEPRFMLTAEISSIYKKNARVRKVHNVIFSPDFRTCKKIQKSLVKIGGNITSDGRPILGLDSKDLLELCLKASEEIFFVPAHIWTPWFSVLGDKSGFDCIEECFEDLTKHIHAVETGLSTDPPMHWLCSFLDNFTLISNSDAHSPEKLGRNANLFNTELSYKGITRAIKTGDPKRFLGTIDLFPQEGKYHYDGHRKCDLLWSPLETLRNKGICPKCAKKVTVGVMNRIARLSDRSDPLIRKNQLPFYSIIPLKEILSEILGCGANTKKVDKKYREILGKTGTELDLLLNVPLSKIKKTGDKTLTEAIKRMRERRVYIREGFDGEFGRITLFREGETRLFDPEPLLFEIPVSIKPPEPRKLINFDLQEYTRLSNTAEIQEIREEPKKYGREKNLLKGLNKEQKKAAMHGKGPALILAGPGSGKTRTLSYRMAFLIKTESIPPENILAITFTNKAALEVKQRIEALVSDPEISRRLRVFTFHGFGYDLLLKHAEKTERQKGFIILDEVDKEEVLKGILGRKTKKSKKISGVITDIKQNLKTAEQIKDKELKELFKQYENQLIKANAFDLDDLVYHPVILFREHPEILEQYKRMYPWILVDEYQDVNFAQYELIRSLKPKADSNLFVIGDPNQAIYGFRGADVRFIRQFQTDYPEAKVYSLNKSYRCSRKIVKASSGVLGDQKGEIALLRGFSQGIKIRISENATEKSEAEFVARTIERMIGGTRFFSIDSDITRGSGEEDILSLSDFAVLCRIGRQIPPLLKAFADHSIPCQVVETAPFFKKGLARRIIKVLKHAISPENPFLKENPGKGKTIPSGDMRKLSDITEKNDLISTIEHIGNRYFAREKKKQDEAYEKLLGLAEQYRNNIREFVRFTDLGRGQDDFKAQKEQVNLMTLHASKGLEFLCVFIVGCEEGLIPFTLAGQKDCDPEEERRLLYVGMTRAKKYLYLTHTRRRSLLGKIQRPDKSRFLEGIERDLLEYSKAKARKKRSKQDPQLTLF